MTSPINRRQFIRKALAAAASTTSATMLSGCMESLTGRRSLPRRIFGGTKKPNFVIIFCDDQGYGDVGCYGAEGFQTPNLDKMAAEGMRFTNFYACAPVCTPSRAALMTGCYPQRIGLQSVLFPSSKTGISSEEQTVAEVLKTRGYATACFGKWHLGHHPQFLPMRHGFDEYFGLPYSNDMWSEHFEHDRWHFPDLPLLDGDRIIDYNPDQRQLTTWYTERSVKFIEKNKNKPFLLYLAHSMPHVPLFVSDKFKGKSKQGLYGDVIMEIDWSVGQILNTLKRCGIDEDTLVIFTSDNGPWLLFGDHGGSAGPLREGKGTTFDGGQREPCIMRWPGKIPAGTVCGEVAANMDILPTFAALAGAKLPEKKIDGKNIWPLMAGSPGAKSPHEAFYFYSGRQLHAVRSGRWKLHLKHTYADITEPGSGGLPGKSVRKDIGPALFDLKNDIAESRDVSAEYPQVVERLTKLAQKMREDIGDALLDMPGANIRPCGKKRLWREEMKKQESI